MTTVSLTKQENKPNDNKKSINSFVRRSGRMTQSQKNGWENHWQHFGLENNISGLQAYTNICQQYTNIVVEIGYGMGQSLIQMAKEDKNSGFIGIEVHRPGVGSLLHNLFTNAISNVRTYCADAKEVIANCINDNSIDRLQIFFPDPWHKKKHNKRRLINQQFIKQIIPKLKLGGIIHLATDWQEYAIQMITTLKQFSNLQNCNKNADFSHRPDYRPKTKFENRGLLLGHGTWDILFTKISN